MYNNLNRNLKFTHQKESSMIFMEFIIAETAVAPSEKLFFVAKDYKSIMHTTNNGKIFKDKILIDSFFSNYIDVEKYEFPDFLVNLKKFTETKDCILLGSVKNEKIPFFSL